MSEFRFGHACIYRIQVGYHHLIFNCLSAWHHHTCNEYLCVYPPVRYIPLLNIQSPVRLRLSYMQWIFACVSAGPIHTILNIQSPVRLTSSHMQWIFACVSAGPIHTITSYSIGCPPEIIIHAMNTCLCIRRPDLYHHLIFNCQSAGHYHTCNEYLCVRRSDRFNHLIFNCHSAGHYHTCNEYLCVRQSDRFNHLIFNCQSAGHYHTCTEYLLVYPPVRYISSSNIQSVRLTVLYMEWILVYALVSPIYPSPNI